MGKQPQQSRIEREQFWRGLIRRQQQSGQSIQAFCDSQGVSSPSFYSWRKRLNASNGRPTAQFVPVQVERESAQVTPGQIEIRLPDGTCVGVESGFDPQALRDVLAALERQPC